jgi:hypothetical protein
LDANQTLVFTGANIYGSTGTVVSSSPSPQILPVQVIPPPTPTGTATAV